MGRISGRAAAVSGFTDFERIDWTAPWFAPLAERGARWQRAALALPVLGVPGWWAENEDPAFYHDEQVFRRGRRPPASLKC